MNDDRTQDLQSIRPLVTDVARLAGVSTATVDRVLNQRPGVRAVTQHRVINAAKELGYLPDRDVFELVRPKPMRIIFFLPQGNNRFLQLMGETIRRSQDDFLSLNARCHVEFIESFEPEILARTLIKRRKDADGIAFMALEHPAIREAVNQLAEQDIPTVTFISDISNSRRSAFVGLDNRSAGRLAGYLMARFVGARPAKVAMIAGSLSYRAHEEREMGFLHLFQELFPQIDVVGLREGRDNSDRNYRQTRSLLSQHPDLAGIYNIGGGPEGIARALKEAGRGADIVFIGHGFTAETRALLIDGVMDAVITQDPHQTALKCVTLLTRKHVGEEIKREFEVMYSQVIFRENIP